MLIKFQSRKFLLAVAAGLTALANGEITVSAIIAAVYIAAEAYVDGKAAQ